MGNNVHLLNKINIHKNTHNLSTDRNEILINIVLEEKPISQM